MLVQAEDLAHVGAVDLHTLGSLRGLQHADAVGLGPLDELLEPEQVIAGLRAGRRQGLARHHPDDRELDDRRGDDERNRDHGVHSPVQRGEAQHPDQGREARSRQNRQRTHAPVHLAAKAACDELLVRGLQDPLRRRREPGVAAAELELLAGLAVREQPLQQHPAVPVGLGRVDQHGHERRPAEQSRLPSTIRMLPTTACSRTSAGIAFVVSPSSTALSRASITLRRRVLRDDRRATRVIAQLARTGIAGEPERAGQTDGSQQLQPPPRRGQVRVVERHEGALFEPQRDRHGLVREHGTRRSGDGTGIRHDLAGVRRALIADVARLLTRRSRAMSAGIVTRAVTRPNCCCHSVPLTSQ